MFVKHMKLLCYITVIPEDVRLYINMFWKVFLVGFTISLYVYAR